MEWIPCIERLPEEGEKVLITYYIDGDEQNRHVGTSKIGIKSAYTSLWECPCNIIKEPFERMRIIAWRPLPEPYKGE